MQTRALILALLLCACGDDDDDTVVAGDGGGRDAATDSGRPTDAGRDDGGRTDAGNDANVGSGSTLMLDGMAEGETDEDAGTGSVECRFFGVIDAIEYEANGDFTGTLIAGELVRRYTGADGVGGEFQALLAGPVSLEHTSATEVELRFVGDQPDDALQLWQQLEVVTGEERGDNRYGGEWLCAPGLLNDPGFRDIDLTITGEWTLAPSP